MVKGAAVDALDCRLGIKLKHIIVPPGNHGVLSPMSSNEHIVFLVGVEIVKGEVRGSADGPLKPDTKFILIVRMIVVYGAGVSASC